MLKWAVNGHRQTPLQNENYKIELPIAASEQQKRNLKRKSSDLGALRTRNSWHDKENQYTSTPLHASSRSFCESPSRKMDSLKDLSNIVPETLSNTPLKSSFKRNSQNILKTPDKMPGIKNVPNNYASTLPTLEVEYSPCALIPGPLLALRGVGIPDSYFEKPRYITPHSKENFHTPVGNVIHTTKLNRHQNASPLKCPVYMEESTLSSTKMGDATLERMIDAILDSNRKERKPAKSQKPALQQANMSPTYTPAEDPASDLQEVWDSEKARYRQKEQKFRARLTRKSLFTEREVCSPELQKTLDAGQLKRQRGVRRKRRMTQITTSVLNSAQKLLNKTSQVQKSLPYSPNPRKIFKAEFLPEEIHTQKRIPNLSPDSGHNSSSDYEQDENDSTLECTTDDNKTPDITKGKLNFSLQSLNQKHE